MTDTVENFKGLFVLSKLLGGESFTQNLVRAVNKILGITPVFLFLEAADYKRFSAPKLIQLSSGLETQWVIRKKFKDDLNIRCGNFDFLFFQSISFLLAFDFLIKKYPAAVAHDSTSILAQKLNYLEKPAFRVKMKGVLNNAIFTPYLRKVIRNVDIFLPRTEWCANSLREDFAVSTEKIHVTLPPQDLSLFKPFFMKIGNDKPNLLFVGNDFERKGGDFLINLYEACLSDKANLTIVSNDAKLRERKFSAGIEVVQGLTPQDQHRLAEIFQRADIFVFPTRKEHLGIVLCEAASSGLALIATDVGGVSDVVKDGYNGYLMPYGSGIEQWTGKIRELISDGHKLELFKRNSRKLAEEKLSLPEFENKIEHIIKTLVHKAIKKV
ncbi:MAG: glycosyltransferase family 4 protein [Nitrospiria bacterium]